MDALKSQYQNVKDPLTPVSARVPESLHRALKEVADGLNITVSQAAGYAIQQYVDGIRSADMALELKLIADKISSKSSEIFNVNSALLANQIEMMAMLKRVLDDDLEINRLIMDSESLPGDLS